VVGACDAWGVRGYGGFGPPWPVQGSGWCQYQARRVASARVHCQPFKTLPPKPTDPERRKSAKGEVRAAVVEAVHAGYRHIDAAAVYANEQEVGGRGQRDGGGWRRWPALVVDGFEYLNTRSLLATPPPPCLSAPPPLPPSKQNNCDPKVGEALSQVLSEGVVSRDQLFVTSKVWNTEHGAAKARAACLKTLKDLRVGPVDTHHSPLSRGQLAAG
jgi:hypothetical protein